MEFEKIKDRVIRVFLAYESVDGKFKKSLEVSLTILTNKVEYFVIHYPITKDATCFDNIDDAFKCYSKL